MQFLLVIFALMLSTQDGEIILSKKGHYEEYSPIRLQQGTIDLYEEKVVFVPKHEVDKSFEILVEDIVEVSKPFSPMTRISIHTEKRKYLFTCRKRSELYDALQKLIDQEK